MNGKYLTSLSANINCRPTRRFILGWLFSKNLGHQISTYAGAGGFFSLITFSFSTGSLIHSLVMFYNFCSKNIVVISYVFNFCCDSEIDELFFVKGIVQTAIVLNTYSLELALIFCSIFQCFYDKSNFQIAGYYS